MFGTRGSRYYQLVLDIYTLFVQLLIKTLPLFVLHFHANSQIKVMSSRVKQDDDRKKDRDQREARGELWHPGTCINTRCL
jgi:hypothetical protein